MIVKTHKNNMWEQRLFSTSALLYVGLHPCDYLSFLLHFWLCSFSNPAKSCAVFFFYMNYSSYNLAHKVSLWCLAGGQNISSIHPPLWKQTRVQEHVSAQPVRMNSWLLGSWCQDAAQASSQVLGPQQKRSCIRQDDLKAETCAERPCTYYNRVIHVCGAPWCKKLFSYKMSKVRVLQCRWCYEMLEGIHFTHLVHESFPLIVWKYQFQHWSLTSATPKNVNDFFRLKDHLKPSVHSRVGVTDKWEQLDRAGTIKQPLNQSEKKNYWSTSQKKKCPSYLPTFIKKKT